MLSIITSRTREVLNRRPRGPLVINNASRQFHGLVAWYPAHPFTLDTGNNWKNAINDQFTLTNTNSVPIAIDQDMGRVFQFASASSQYFKSTSAVLTATPLTLACWFKVTATTDAVLLELHNSASAVVVNCFSVGITSSNKVQARTADATTDVANTVALFTVGEWNHAAATFASSTNRTSYVNGTAPVTNSVSHTPSGLNRTTIGCRFNLDATPSNLMNGLIADARIYNRALGPDEIYALYDPETRWQLYYPIGRVSYFFYTAPIAFNAALDATLGTLTLSSTLEIYGPHSVTDVSVLSASENGPGALYGSFSRLITASAALDKTLGALTLAGISSAAIQPAVSKTLGSLTLAGIAKAAVQPAVSKTLGVLTKSISAQVAIGASVTKTLGALGKSISTQVAIKTATSKTLGALSLAAITSGGGAIASLLKILGGLVSSAIARSNVQAAVVKTFGLLTVTGAATAPRAIAAVIKTLGTLTASGVVATAHAVAVTKTLGSLSGSAAATSPRNVAVAKTLGSLTLSATVTSPRSASVAKSLGSLSLSASVSGPIRATVSLLSPLGLPSRFYGVFNHAPGGIPDLTAAVNKVLGPAVLAAITRSDVNTAVVKTLGAMVCAAATTTVTVSRTNADFSVCGPNSQPGRLYGNFAKQAGVITASLTKTLGTLTFGPPVQLLLEAGGGLVLEAGGALLLEAGKAVAEVRIAGSVTKTLGALTCAAAVGARVNANFARALGPLGRAIGVQVASQPALTKTLGTLTSTGQTAVITSVSVTKTLGAVTLSSAAAHGAATNASVVKTLGALTASTIGRVHAQTSLSRTLGIATSTGVIRPGASTAVSKALVALVLASDVDVRVSTAVSKTLGQLGLTANVVGVPGRVAALIRTLGPLAATGAITSNISVALTKTLEPLAKTISTVAEMRVALAKVLSPLTLSGHASIAYSAALNQTLKPLTLTSVLKIEIEAAVNAILGPLILSTLASSDRNVAVDVTLGALIANERLAALATTLGTLNLNGAVRGLGEPVIIIDVEGEIVKIVSVEGEMVSTVNVEGNLVQFVSEDFMANPQVGAIGVSLEYTVKAVDPIDGKLKPVDLGTASQLKILLQKPQGRTTTEYPGQLKTSGADGIIRYVTQSAADLDRSGMWLIQPRFVLGGFNGHIEKQFFYVERNLAVQP